MMQHRKSDLVRSAIVISDLARLKRDRAARINQIRINHLFLASKAAIEAIGHDVGMKPSWYCLRVLTSCESAVENALQHADVECLVVRSNPYKVVRRGRIREVPAMPVIRGYVLVRCLGLPQALHGLLSVKGVASIVGGVAGPYRVTDKTVNEFREMAEEGKYDHKEKPLHNFMVKEQVRVCDGPFASFEGIILDIDAKRYRVRVEVNIFGRTTPVELDIAQIGKL